MRGSDILVGPHIWSCKNNLDGLCSFFSLSVNMTLKTTVNRKNGPSLSVTLKWGGGSESPYKEGGPVSVLGRAR